MTRVCFVGNSHLACIKMGWDTTADQYSELKVSFFGAPANGLTWMRPANGGYLVSENDILTANLMALWGTDRFRPDDYDVLCLVGMGMLISVVGHLYRDYRSSVHRNRHGTFRLLSPDCFQAAANGLVAKTRSARLFRQIRVVSQRPVVFAAQPARRPIVPDRYKPSAELKRTLASGDDSALHDVFANAIQQLSANVYFLPQPEETRLNLFFSKAEYSKGSRQLESTFSEHENDETNHMNSAYGALVVRDLHLMLSRNGVIAKLPARTAIAENTI